MTFSHTYSRLQAQGGFEQFQGQGVNEVKFPVASLAKFDLVFGTASYSVVLPAGAFIFDTDFVVKTTFSGGTTPTFKIGTTAGGNNILAATDLTAGSAGLSPLGITLAAPYTIYVTISGAPTAGAATLLVHFVNL